jgi:hypothetical protein
MESGRRDGVWPLTCTRKSSSIFPREFFHVFLRPFLDLAKLVLLSPVYFVLSGFGELEHSQVL